MDSTKPIRPEDVASITQLELAFGTTRFLPAEDAIPQEFYSARNIYVQIITAIFLGGAIPDGEITIHDGIEAETLNRFIRAHVASFEPRHQHKIAGVAYLLSQLSTVEQPKERAHDERNA